MINRLLLYFCVCLLAGVHSAYGQIVWLPEQDSIDIAQRVTIYEDKHHNQSIETVSAANFATNFKPSDHKVLNFFNDSYYWIKFDVDNQSDENIVLELAQPILREVHLFEKDTLHQAWRKETGGFTVPIQKHHLKHHYQLFPIASGKHTYFLRFQTLGLAVPIRMWQKDLYDERINRQKIFFGIFTGLMGFVILINLFFFFSLRRRAYLHYALLVSFYFMSSLNVEGFRSYITDQADLFYGFLFIPVLNMPIGITYVMFFLETKKYTPRLHKFCLAVLIYFCSYIIWHNFLTPLQLFYVTHIHGLCTVLIMTSIGIQTGRQGNKLGYYYFIGYLIFFIIAIIDTVNRITGLPPAVFGVTYISIGFLAEAFLLAYLLTKRFEWEKNANDQERINTHNLLLEKTKENERMVVEQNIMLERKVQERTEELTKEKRKSDELLLNTLPADVAEELRETGKANARLFEHVTVLFTDFVNFTGLSTQMTPAELVSEIHENFTAFDAIMEKHGLEKIKTIGDAYLAVCGLPIERDDHAQRVIRAAMDIRDYVKQRRGKFQVRIGVNSGAVVAGIVGVKKYAYDIWGDAVNTANRMETHSEEGRINISATTFALIQQDFRCEYRGKIQVKGKGEIDMYFLLD